MPTRFARLRRLFLVAALFIAVGFYYLGVEFAAPSRNVIRSAKRSLFPTDYTFFSGNENGFYYRIASALEEATKEGEHYSKVKREKSDGATNNLFKVASSQNSLGLIQEDTIPTSLVDPEFLNDRIRVIAPLYTEKLHILYWPISIVLSKDSLKSAVPLTITSRKSRADISKLEENALNRRATKEGYMFLSHPKVQMNLGTPNSGSLLLAHAILDRCGVVNFEQREHNEQFDVAMEKFLEKKIHVVFFNVGSPLSDIGEAIKKGARLMSVTGVDLIRALHNDFGFILRPFRIGKDYPGSGNVATVGTRAFLVSSKDVPNSALLEVLSILKGLVEGAEKSGTLSGVPFQFPFKSKELEDPITAVSVLCQLDREERLRNILLFLTSVVVGTIVILRTINACVSSFKKAAYFKEVNEVRQSIREQVAEGNTKATRRSAVESELAKLDGIRSSLLDDYETGGLTDQAIDFVCKQIRAIEQQYQSTTGRHSGSKS